MEKESKSRNKSRTRSMFSRKKSHRDIGTESPLP
jgi:hypothetical protein